MPNNFDMSSTGTNIEAVAYWDVDISQYEFKENFEILQHSGYRTSTVAYYIDNGNVKGADDIEFTIEGERGEKERFYLYYVSGNSEGLKDWTDDELNESILDACEERVTLVNMDDFSKVMLKDFKLTLRASKNIEKLVTRGYSQGDYATVYYCPNDLEAVWGNAVKESELQDIFDRLFWDAPIHARVNVNGEDYYYDGDRYEFEREAFLKQVAEQSGASYEALDAILPKEPSYD